MSPASKKWAAGFAGTPSNADALNQLTRLANVSGVGLDGYSPVSLSGGKLWKKGESQFAWKYAGVVYFMTDAEELDKFRTSPEKFAPRYSGFDPTVLNKEGVAIAGDVQYGSFYKGQLYLHANEESRREFLAKPANYPLPPRDPACLPGRSEPRPDRSEPAGRIEGLSRVTVASYEK